MNDGVCPGPQIGVVFRRVGLDLGAGQRRGRSEVRVTIDDHQVTHCPKGNADPSNQADIHCGRRVGIGGKEESILVPEKGQRDQPRTIMAGSRYPLSLEVADRRDPRPRTSRRPVRGPWVRACSPLRGAAAQGRVHGGHLCTDGDPCRCLPSHHRRRVSGDRRTAPGDRVTTLGVGSPGVGRTACSSALRSRRLRFLEAT